MSEDSFIFNKYYDEIFSYDARTDKKIYLGNATNKKCRFCDRASSEVTFTNKAHAIPELLNNKGIISNYECDSCNNKFSETIENQLGIMLAPYRAIRQLRKKGGGKVQLSSSTKFKVNNGEFSVTTPIYKESTDNINIMTGIDAKGKLFLRIKSKVEYTPIECYMAYVKMAISIAPETEVYNLKWAIDWLMTESHTHEFKELMVVEQVVKMEFSSIYTKLYKLNPSCPFDIPTYAYMFAYCDFIITIYLPACGKKHDMELLKEIVWLPNMQLGANFFRSHRYEDMNVVNKVSVSLPYEYNGSEITWSIQ
jgi:hypothetical protein